MHKSATKCNETVGKWCKNKHGASKIIDTLETYHSCLLEPSSAFTVIVWDNLVWVHTDFEECFVALCMISVCFPLENCLSCMLMIVSIGSIMLYLLGVCPLVKV
jgi:hypothetical protein